MNLGVTGIPAGERFLTSVEVSSLKERLWASPAGLLRTLQQIDPIFSGGS